MNYGLPFFRQKPGSALGIAPGSRRGNEIWHFAKWTSLIIAFTPLAGCLSSQKCINYLECPDGMSDCRVQAHDTCPAGYHVLDDADVGSDFGDFAKQHFEGARSGVPHIVVTCD